MSDSSLKKAVDDSQTTRDSVIESKKKTNKVKNYKRNNNPSKGSNINNTQGHHRQGQHRRQQNSPFSQNFDLSIQEQLTNGQLKYKGKKSQISINHLLDFNLPEVERTDDNLSHKKKKTHRKKKFQDEHINLSGDSFINVNYRILVKQNGDYQLQDNDPNIVIPDENIVAVMVPKGQNCPICLCEEPVAPRMVTCGHIFCYACLLNFFAIEEPTKKKTNSDQVFTKKKTLKECPLCNNIIRPKRVKNVIFQENSEFFDERDMISKVKPEIDEIEFQLMVRPHDSMLPLPVRLNLDYKKVGNFPNVTLKEIGKYARILKCDTSFTLDLLNKDLESIKTQFEIDKALYNDDGKYSYAAIEQINEAITQILSNDIDELDNALHNITLEDLQNKTTSIESESKSHPTSLNDSNSFFFYQTFFNESTKFFLSSLDVKIMKSIFENYSDFPETINVEIENIHYDMEVTENFIRRYKYMSFLPWGTEIAFIDLDWKNIPFIPTEIYQKFMPELRQRSREYKQKKMKEDKLKKIYEAKLEEETAAFYRNENSDFYPSHESSVEYNSLRNSSIVLNSLSGAKERGVINNDSESDMATNNKRKKGYQTTTIWGTPMDVLTDEKTIKENDEFAEMLMNKMQNEKTQGKKSKKKGKVLLFST